MEFDELSNIVIGCAIAVHRTLGPGLLKSAYEQCLARELTLTDTISNLVAGIMIVIYKLFEIGSEVDISGSCGTVTDINLRYT